MQCRFTIDVLQKSENFAVIINTPAAIAQDNSRGANFIIPNYAFRIPNYSFSSGNRSVILLTLMPRVDILCSSAEVVG